MQTLQHEIEPDQPIRVTADHPVLQGLDADQALAYAEEVRLLRQRVATLETALEAATAAANDPALQTSVFSQPQEPAVVAVRPHLDATSAPTSKPGFAQAWADDEAASFEERVAERAFFQATTVDEQSRSWLMER